MVDFRLKGAVALCLPNSHTYFVSSFLLFRFSFGA